MDLRTMSLLDSPPNIPGYAGHTHFWERLTRRQFVATATGTLGLVLGSGLRMPKLADAQVSSVLPKPIPGGIQFLGPGTEIFHVFGPLAARGNDPSTITDFTGVIAAAEIQGHVTVTPPVTIGTGTLSRLFFDNDMRFMKGQYIGVDGQQHTGTFSLF